MTAFRTALAVLAAAGLPVAAVATTYDCSFTPAKRDAYIASPVRLTVDEASGKATAFDAYVKARHGGPIPARFTRRNAKSIQWDWEVEVPYKRNRTSQADFKVTLNLSSMSASIRAHVPGDFEENTGSGTCRTAN